jgi:hypothetical protein
MTTVERLGEAEQLVAQLLARAHQLDPARKARLESLRLFARVEKVFPGAKLRYDIPPLPLPPPKDPSCPVCGRRERWVSIHGVSVCGYCHPPASPELVARWTDGPIPDPRDYESTNAEFSAERGTR